MSNKTASQSSNPRMTKTPMFQTWISANPGVNKHISAQEWFGFFKLTLQTIKDLETARLHSFLDNQLPKLSINGIECGVVMQAMHHLSEMLSAHIAQSEKIPKKSRALLESHISLLFDNITEHISSTYRDHGDIEIIRHDNEEHDKIDRFPLMAYHVQHNRFGGSGYYNFAFQQWTGMSSEMFFSDPDWQALIHPEDYPDVVASLDAQIKKGSPFYELRYRFRNHEGEWHHVSELGKLGMNDGRPAEFHGIISKANVDSKYHMERLAMEDVFRYLLAESDELALVLDKDARIIFATPVLLQYLNANHQLDQYVNNYSWKAAGEHFFDLLNYENRIVSKSFWRSILVESSPSKTLLLKLENWDNEEKHIIEFTPYALQKSVRDPLQILWGRIVPNRNAEDDFVDRQDVLIQVTRSLLKTTNQKELYPKLLHSASQLIGGADSAALLVNGPDGYQYYAGKGFADEFLRGRLLVTRPVIASLNKLPQYRNLGRRAGRVESAVLKQHLRQTLKNADYEFLLEHARLEHFHDILIGQIWEKNGPHALLLLFNNNAEVPFSKFDEQLFELFVQHASTSLQTIFAANTLQQVEDSYVTVLERSPFAVFIVRRDEIRLYNPKFLELTASAPENVNLNNVWSFIHNDDLEQIQSTIASLSRDPGSVELEFRMVSAQGKVHTCFGVFAQINYDGGAAVLCEVMDISKLRRLEDQLVQAQKMETVGNLTAAITHDFNNILSAIIPGSQLIMRDAESERVKKQAKTIFQLAQRAGAITRQLLSYTRVDSSPSELFDLNELLSETKEMLNRMVGPNIDIQYRWHHNLPHMRGNRNQIVQLLINLVNNACEAMEFKGTITITTDLKVVKSQQNEAQAFRPGKYLQLGVRDTGKGIPDEIRTKIFKPFFTTKSVKEGNGLGLSIVYGILKKHNGYIFTQNYEGSGAGFKIYLPASDEVKTAVEPSISLQTSNGTSLSTGKGTLLLVDDEIYLLETLAGMVNFLGYHCIEASSGEEALELYRKQKGKIDLVILDYAMPGLNGGETLRKLREIDNSVNVLLCTGYTDQHKISKLMQEQAVAYLPKPFTIEILGKMIRNSMQEAQPALQP